MLFSLAGRKPGPEADGVHPCQGGEAPPQLDHDPASWRAPHDADGADEHRQRRHRAALPVWGPARAVGTGCRSLPRPPSGSCSLRSQRCLEGELNGPLRCREGELHGPLPHPEGELSGPLCCTCSPIRSLSGLRAVRGVLPGPFSSALGVLPRKSGVRGDRRSGFPVSPRVVPGRWRRTAPCSGDESLHPLSTLVHEGAAIRRAVSRSQLVVHELRVDDEE